MISSGRDVGVGASTEDRGLGPHHRRDISFVSRRARREENMQPKEPTRPIVRLLTNVVFGGR